MGTSLCSTNIKPESVGTCTLELFLNNETLLVLRMNRSALSTLWLSHVTSDEQYEDGCHYNYNCSMGPPRSNKDIGLIIIMVVPCDHKGAINKHEGRHHVNSFSDAQLVA